ncbi:unnamed protein product, partial [Polarella glacialis]
MPWPTAAASEAPRLSAQVERMVLEAMRRKDATIPAGWPAIVAAAYENETDSVKWLLDAKADPNAPAPRKANALWHAVSNRNLVMVRLLLQASADPNHSRKNNKGVWRSLLDNALNDGVPDSILHALRMAGARRGVPGKWDQSQTLQLADQTVGAGLLALADDPSRP